MNFLVGYFVGIWNTVRRARMWLLLYFITLVFAVLLAIPFFDVMDQSIGNSMELPKLLSGYDHTVVDDFLHIHGQKLGAVFGQFKGFTLFFVLLYIFLTGGILQTYDLLSEKFSGQRFWSGCTNNFWRVFRVFLLFFVIQILVALLVYYPLGEFFGKGFDGVKDERTFYKVGAFAVGIHILIASFFGMISDYTKVRLIKKNEYSVFKEAWQSTKFVVRHFFKTYPLYLLNLLTFVGLVALYVFLGHRIGMVSKTTIVIMLVIQQLFVFLRIGTKLMNLASISAMYDAVVLKTRKQEKPLEIEEMSPIANVETSASENNNNTSQTSDGPMEILESQSDLPSNDEENQDYNEREFLENLDEFQEKS